MTSSVDSVDIIVSGHLCLDLIPGLAHVTLQQLTIPGRLIEIGPIAMSTGGTVSNTGLALHRLGANVRLMATVGDDLLGQATIASIRARGEELSRYITVQSGQPSSYSVVLNPKNTDRILMHCTGVNSTFGLANIDFSLVSGARIFHLGYPPYLPALFRNDGAELQELYRRATATGVVTSVDMAWPDPQTPSGRVNWRKILEGTLPYVDVFLPSIDEILYMMRRHDSDAWQGKILPHLTARYLRDLADELLAMGAVIVGFKLGELGIYLRTADAPAFQGLQRLPLNAAAWGNVELWTPAYQVQVTGTTGAGDSAFAGFLAALLHGLGPLEAIQMASAVGACNVEAVDATSGIRTWEDTQARLKAGWPTRPERLPGF